MKIPYVIDNQTHRLADVLNGLLATHSGRSLDVASAFFSVKMDSNYSERIWKALEAFVCCWDLNR